ncbi:MAG: head maturation protease, ClpP-related [Bacteroidota bacterium]
MQSGQKKYWITNKINASTAEVLLYGYIDNYDVSAGDFVKELRGLEKEFSMINVRINSGGGSVFEGFAIYNAMKQSRATINTYIDGLAASMASIIALGGAKVYMSKMARLMTHQPSSGSYGNSEELRKNADLLDGLEQTMCAIYAGKTGKSKEDCKSKFLNGKDNWFNAEDAKKEGLVDEVYDADGVETPKETASIKHVWDGYQHQFAAKFNQQTQNDNMKIEISAASKAALGISGEVTDFTALDNAIAGLKAKADQADSLRTAKEKAEKDLNDYKEQAEAGEATAMLDAAAKDKKITVEQKKVFAEQFKGNNDGLKAVLATLKPYESKVGNEEEGEDDELKALNAKSYDELDKSGELEKLKAKSVEAFKAKYKVKFGREYSGK